MISQNKRAIFFHLGVKKMSWTESTSECNTTKYFWKRPP